MKKYTIRKGDTYSSLAQKFGLIDNGILKTYHNLHCPEEDVMHDEPVPGKTMIIIEDSRFLADKGLSETPIKESDQELTDHNSYFKENSEQASEKEKQAEKSEDSNPHDGKYFIIQKGTVQCNHGSEFPKFKVTSHQKHYWNDQEEKADYLAVTEEDLQFDPPVRSFGQCRLNPSSGGYLPCSYAPVGKWQKAYEKVKVMGKSCLTEISELMCSTGGKISILKHGQQSEISKSQVMNARTKEQQVYNPIVNYDEFKEYMNDQQYYM
ncbi:DUF4280 and LysM peptidoglycan-binding domain-containing protein [Chryseobacterium vrystaatense]|uniref:LysM domain-containing protein n=1 Tax=Chryseobacterium vrystaatense TaxID=307480 RepID=A0A1M4W5W1_9FLAO|nr:PAAR-like protein [Chryseobacterium vrystaatense]SHE76651.1 protein of unknown function [Chryseobacterium vrystaatense]